MTGTRIALADVEDVLRDALTLRDASLVIFRRGLLVEFKTGLIAPGLSASVEAGHRSWQIGPFDGHHCHLDLDAVRAIEFDAELVECQGGRLNYTVWFIAEADCGNPHRPQGLFSVTLNAPYDPDGSPRLDIVDAMYALHARHRHRAGVRATAGFLDAAIVRNG